MRFSCLVHATCFAALAFVGCGRSASPPTSVQNLSTATQSPIENSIVDVDAPRPHVEEEQRVIQLDNGLEALLLWNPKFQKSAVALDVAVGSLEDPLDHLGLAHFLEHMLFLGTDKYPEVDEYSTYLSANQGTSNAYTAAERTNYVFQVSHDGLEGALDRFAQFFISPRFNEEFVERETNAVHSEHQKNLQSDYWRQRMVERRLHRDGHPRQRFSTGSLETLGNVTRDTLVEFYRTYYSANVMKLCILSTAPLDQQEAWVRERFSAIPTHDRAPLSYPSDVFDLSALPQLVQVKPVTDQRELLLIFPVAPTIEHWQEKPASMLGSLIGHEGEGSLLSQLKQENLATSLHSGIQNESWSGYFNIGISLTDAGRANLNRVYKLVFAYIEMLQREGLRPGYFSERKAISELNFFYRDHAEGMWTASGYASQMHRNPAAELQKRRAVITRYDPALFARYLDALKPSRMRAILLAPDVTTDQVEPHYGTEYGVSSLEPADLVPPHGLAGLFHYPAENPYIADDLSLLAGEGSSGPYRLMDDDVGLLWFEPDHRFKLPKGRVSLLLHTEEAHRSVRSHLLTTLYARALSESLNEWRYPILEAGLSASVSSEARGIRLRFAGYSQRIPALISAYAGQLENISIDESAFAALRDKLAREFANAEFAQPYRQNSEEYSWLTVAWKHHRRDARPLVESVTLEEVKAFAENIFTETAIEGVAYGNFDGPTLKSAVETLYSSVASRPLSRDRWKKAGELLHVSSSRSHVTTSSADNAAWLLVAQFGPDSPGLEATLRVGEALLETPFFVEMRTRQQLGYIAFSGASTQQDGLGMYFALQSKEYPAAELARRAHSWLEEFIPTMRDLPAEQFESTRTAIISSLREEDSDMGERLSTIAREALHLGGDFDRKNKVIAEVEALTLEQVSDAFANALQPTNRRTLSIYHDAAGEPRSVPLEPEIQDPEAFKQNTPTY